LFFMRGASAPAGGVAVGDNPFPYDSLETGHAQRITGFLKASATGVFVRTGVNSTIRWSMRDRFCAPRVRRTANSSPSRQTGEAPRCCPYRPISD
jgi:hypothetical protein